MKTTIINPTGYYIWMAMLILLLVFPGCKKTEPPPPLPQAYSNLNDDTTTSIIASIPRIELSLLKSTKITIYLSVTDQNGNPMTEFNQYNFVIKQVCVGETDTTFVASISFNKLNVEGKNIASSLTMDYSGSMSWYLGDMENAVWNFMKQKRFDDQIELIKFSDNPAVIQPFTNDTSLLRQKLFDFWPGSGGSTAFYDGVDLGLNDIQQFIHQDSENFFPAVIGFTDGADNSSNNTMEGIIDKSKINQIPVYTLGFGGASDYILNTIANETGGRYYYAPDITQLASLYTLISGQLQNVYVVSWIYDNPGCSEVLIVVEASYESKSGMHYSRVEKIFYPL